MSNESVTPESGLKDAGDHYRLAVYYCKRGDHRQAARHFIIAAFFYEMAGDDINKAKCEGQWDAEMRQLRPSAPVNIAALTE